MNAKRVICTIMSNNYIARGITLLESLRDTGSTAKLFALIVDDFKPELYPSEYTFISLDQLEIKELCQMQFKYNLIELNTAVKPFFLEYLMEKKKAEKVLYIDPDMMAFSGTDFLFKILDRDSILLTPHVLTESSHGLLDSNSFLLYGIYNLGFIGVKNDNSGRGMLHWWQAKLADYCYADYYRGLSVDQRWADFFPAIFNNVRILKHPGINMAYWNCHERELTESNDTYVINGEFPLVLFHFSGYGSNQNANLETMLSCVSLRGKTALEKIYLKYEEKFKVIASDRFSGIPYAYDRFENGVIISKEMRRIYARTYKSNLYKGNPFKLSAKNCYYNWLAKKKLLDTAKSVDLVNEIIAARKKLSRISATIFNILRRLLGARRYYALIRGFHWATELGNNIDILYGKREEV